MSRLVTALVVRGLSYRGSTATTIFADGDLDTSTINALAPIIGSGTRQVVQLLAPGSLSGATWGASVRDPVGRGGTPQVTLYETQDGDLAQVLSADPSRLSTACYLVQARSVTPGATSLLVRGSPAPASGDVLHIGTEAIRVTGVSTDAADETLHTLTVVRGACGSWAQAHAVDPDLYLPGEDGAEDLPLLTSRPRWGEVPYEAALWQIEMKPHDQSAADSIVWTWYGTVSGRPVFDVERQTWTLGVSSLTSTLAAKRIGGAEDLPLSYLMPVTRTRRRLLVQGTSSVQVLEPERWSLILSPEEAERLFRVPLRYPLGILDPTLVEALDTALDADERVSYEAAVKAGSYTWIGAVRGVEILGDSRTVRVSCELRAATPGATLDDTPFDSRPYSAGWSTGGIARVSTGLGEPQPTCTIRVRVVATFPAAARLLLSSASGGTAHGADDVLIGLRGAGIDPALVNTGTEAATPLDVALDTQEWARLGQILDAEYEYHLTPGTTLGDWLANELTLASCLLGPSFSFGKLGARRWYRPRSGPASLVPLAREPGAEVEVLSPVRALEVQRGINAVTLAPTYRKPVRLQGATRADVERPLVVRVWQRGGAISDEELAAGPIGEVVRAQLAAGLGGPRIWEVPVSLGATLGLADLVDWSDPSQVTAAGRGLTIPGLVVGVDRDQRGGRQVVRILEDVLNRRAEALTSTAGRIGASLRIDWVREIDATTWDVGVSSAPEGPDFDLRAGHDSIWRSIQDAEGWVRVLQSAEHTPSGDEERPGYADLYAQVTGLTNGTPASAQYLTLSIDAGWARGGLTVADILRAGAYVLFSDRRSSAQTPPALAVAPIPSIGYADGSGYDALRWGPPTDARPSADGHTSTVGA